MTAVRSRRAVKHYRRMHQEPRPEDCVFCAIGSDSQQVVAHTKHFKIIHNIFPYSLWDSQAVTDHLMIVPLLHTATLANLPPAAGSEFFALIAKYESRGYNVWARAPGSNMKSVEHQHTHLIKLSGRQVRALFFIRKPYLRMLLK